MFKSEPSKNEANLQDAIDSLYARMSLHAPESDEYAKMNAQLGVLLGHTKETSKKRVSPDTWAIVGANLVGILLVLNYERAGIITSKAWSSIMKASR